MNREVILYNLKEDQSYEDYLKYVEEKKGPFLTALPAAVSFTLIHIEGSAKKVIPYEIVGILEFTNEKDWFECTKSEAFGAFMKEWSAKVQPDFHVLFGDAVYQKFNELNK